MPTSFLIINFLLNSGLFNFLYYTIQFRHKLTLKGSVLWNPVRRTHTQSASRVALTCLCFGCHRPFCTSHPRDSTYYSLLMKEFSLRIACYTMPVHQYNLHSLLVKGCLRVFSKSCALLKWVLRVFLESDEFHSSKCYSHLYSLLKLYLCCI